MKREISFFSLDDPKKNSILSQCCIGTINRAYSEKIPMLQSWRGFFARTNYAYILVQERLLSQNLRFRVLLQEFLPPEWRGREVVDWSTTPSTCWASTGRWGTRSPSGRWTGNSFTQSSLVPQPTQTSPGRLQQQSMSTWIVSLALVTTVIRKLTSPPLTGAVNV